MVAVKRGVTKPTAKVYSKWVTTHLCFLRTLRATPEPLWTSRPDVWEPAISETPSVTVVGGHRAKREKVRIVPVGDSLQEVDEDLLDSLGAVAADLPQICAVDPGSPPILDVRLHKALNYFLEIRTHYGAALWTSVGLDAEGMDLHAWDKSGPLPCAVSLLGEAPDRSYWRRVSAMLRVTLTISHVEGPSSLWVALKLPAVK